MVMPARSRTYGALLVACLAGLSCSSVVPPDALPKKTTRVYLDGIQPQSTEDYACGPSTLAAVLAYQGKPVPEENISAEIYSPTAHGTLLSDMAWYAQQQGLQAKVQQGTLEDLKDATLAGNPPIVLLDLGMLGVTKAHFSAVSGYTDDGLFILAVNNPRQFVATSDFARKWKNAGNFYLLITP